MKSAQICIPLVFIIFRCLNLLTFGVDQIDATWAPALPGIKCVHDYGGRATCDDGNCNFDDPNNIFKLACNTDCIAQHGATFGYCLKTDICNCGPPVYSIPEHPLQCIDIKHAELYQTICDEDCKCTHNKVGGGCNFKTKACECGPTNLSPTLDCPYRTSNEYFKKLVERYNSSAIGIDVPKVLRTPE